MWLQKIQINHKKLNFTIDFSDFRVVIDVYKYQNWTKTYKYNNLNTYERNLKKMINLKGEVTLF